MDKRILWCPGHELIVEDVERAENCYLYDSRGRRYTDLESGVWCTSIGHCHPRVTEAMKAQAERLVHTGFNYSSRIVEEAAREILVTVGFVDGTCTLLASGSEAINYAVSTAQSVMDRPLLLTFSLSYLGAFGSARIKSDQEWHCFELGRCLECPQASTCDPECAAFREIPFESIGGFVFEPGSSPGTVRFPPQGLIANIAREIERRDGLMICNEVTTGLGRTGKWYGYEHYRVEPDIVAIGKGLGNGYPVSAVAIAHRLHDRLKASPLKYSQSHQNDALGAAVATEVLRVLREENLIERSRVIGARLVEGLNAIRARTNVISDVRGRGLMVAVDLQDDEEQSRTRQVREGLLRSGFIIGRRPGIPAFRMDPALTIPEPEVDRLLRCLADLVDEVAGGRG